MALAHTDSDGDSGAGGGLSAEQISVAIGVAGVKGRHGLA